jgi:type VI secretion system secreted protein VgrG
LHVADAIAQQAELDLTTAYNDAMGRQGAVGVSGNLGGRTLTPGLYKSTSSLEISSGDLTLDARGHSGAVFIFQMASTFNMTTGRMVILTHGARARNIFWAVGSSASFGTRCSFYGTLLVHKSVSMATGTSMVGRALARVAAVTMQSNTIVKPARR